MDNEELAQRRRRSRITAVIVAALAVLALLIAVPFAMNGTSQALSGNGHGSGNPAIKPIVQAPANVIQCRVNAVTAYMKAMGWQDGQYVIGESNLDTKAAALKETGSLAFGKNGKNVTSRQSLQDMFNSSDPQLQKAAQRQVDKFPSIPKATVLDANNWEIVQMKVPSLIEGNTGIDQGAVVNMGTRQNKAGDAAWLFVDTNKCNVPTSTIQLASMDTPAGSAAPVGLIRVGCINPGNNLVPPPAPQPSTPSTPSTPSSPPTTPPVHTCADTPYPHGTWPNCKDGPEHDPAAQGNAPTGGGPNANPGPGQQQSPGDVTQPPSTPRTNPPAPAPTVPAPQPSTPSNPSPAPVPTKDPAPPPPPEQSAPPTSNPVPTCIIPPGKTSC